MLENTGTQGLKICNYHPTFSFGPLMLYSIFSLVLDVLAGLVGGACLLRLYMQWLRAPFSNPLGQFVLAVSNWIVLPLRRVLPLRAGWDVASLLAALVIELVQFALLWVVAGSGGGLEGALTVVPVLALFGVARLAVSGMTGLLMVYAVLSWVQTRSPLYATVERLCQPLLQPVRRFVPLVGGIDLSPLALLVLLQIAGMVLGALQAAVLH